MLLTSLAVVLVIILKVEAEKFIRDAASQRICKAYRIMCPVGKVCAVQHLKLARKFSIPVCIPESYIPVKAKICNLPPAPGECSARFIRWHYNPNVGNCGWFYYGGCHGNRNNFRTKEGCEKACRVQTAKALTTDHKSYRGNGVVAETFKTVLKDKKRNNTAVAFTKSEKKIRRKNRTRKHKKHRKGNKYYQFRRRTSRVRPDGTQNDQSNKRQRRRRNHRKSALRYSAGGQRVLRLFTLLGQGRPPLTPKRQS